MKQRAGLLLVAHQSIVSGIQVFTWRKLISQDPLAVVAAGKKVVPAFEYGALELQVCELQRLLGKKSAAAYDAQ